MNEYLYYPVQNFDIVGDGIWNYEAYYKDEDRDKIEEFDSLANVV